MKPKRYLTLAVICMLWVGLAISQGSASPINPKLPSTLNFQSLNEIAVPGTEADWSFEMGRLDLVINSSHLSGLRARGSDICCLQYMLYHTVIATDTAEQNALASFAAANGYDPESAFMHYYDNSTVTYSGITETIPGYGGGSATTLQQARVKNKIWGSDRFVYNLKSPLLHKFKASYYRTIMTTGDKPDGIFIDETSPMAAYVPAASAGGHIIEYGNQTVSQAGAAYMTDMTAAFAETNQLMGSDSQFGDRILLPNVAEYVGDFMDLAMNGADGMLTEFWIQAVQPRIPYAFDVAKQLADKGKILIFTQGTYGPELAPPSNYNSDVDRHQMFSLSAYWMAKQGKYTYYQQKAPSNYPLLSSFWVKAREYDVGSPVDPLYTTWQTGTDPAGQNYTIYRREYTKAVMLCRPKVGWTYSDFATQSQAYNLGGTYHLLHYDGTLGPAITSIGLAMGEAVTLVKDGSGSGGGTTDTTPPTISGVAATNVTSGGATITWTTNEAATGVVDYGATTTYGSSAATGSATSQSVNLAGLNPGTVYHYRVTATDTAGNRTVGGDYAFTTTAATTTSPLISVSIAANKTSAKSGDTIVYTVTYKNTGSGVATSVVLTADVDPNVTYSTATNGGTYDATAKVVRWSVGAVQAGASSSVSYTVTVK